MADKEHNDQDTVEPDKFEGLSEKDLEQISGGGGVPGESTDDKHKGWIEITGNLLDMGL